MKQTKRQVIPVHRMSAQSPLGIELTYLEMTDGYDENMVKSNKTTVHRDDYYMFLFLESMTAVFTLDFEEIRLQEESAFYIRPGQAHFASSVRGTKGWALSIDAALVETDYKNILEGQFSTQRPVLLDAPAIERISGTVRLLNSFIQAGPTVFSAGIISSLANVFIGIIAGEYARRHENLLHGKSRPALIAYQFKRLLSEKFRTVKSPSLYAEILNYSLSHLNESVKSVTGFTVSYWIHQQTFLEAKRLLYYTDLDVKEIAVKLGYDDHAYFSRLFSKIAGMSPSAFRRKFRE